MAADDPRFDPQVDLQTRLERLRPLIASANLINGRFGRKVLELSWYLILGDSTGRSLFEF